MKTLAELKEGDKGIITKVKGRGAFRKRIIEMGFVVGKPVIVVKNAPLRDPIEYNIMGYEVSLRRSEAALIEVLNGESMKMVNNSAYHGVQALEQSLKLRPINNAKTITVALVGNPNSGKTTLFNFASNSKERVANYSGVTIDAKSAIFKLHGYTFKLVDLPGTYSITSYTPEELYVRNHIFDELPDVVLNVVDASNLERNLYLTTQLIDMDIKVVLALNMYDEFLQKGDQFDYDMLGKMLGIPIIPTVASKGTGIIELFERIITVHEDRDPDIRHIHVNYGEEIEATIRKLQELLKVNGNQHITNIISPRYLSIKLLEGDQEELTRIQSCVNHSEILSVLNKETEKISTTFSDDPETIITDAKYGFIEGALKETFKPVKQTLKTKSRKIDGILTHKLLSYPVFIGVMWGIFQATFILGDYPMQWIELSMEWLGGLMYKIMPDNFLRDLVVDGIIGGVGGVIVFLPNILILFFFLSLLETTGYMARVAFIVDKLMHKVGLHGRSFIPLLMGFGCNVPAIMATRTIENRSDRMVTMMIIPFMSCSARYPVYILIISAFFDSFRGTILFGIYLLGILFAGLFAWLFKKVLFQANEMPFVMELPPYRMPTSKAIFKQTWFKGRQYIHKMGTIILVASIIIWALGYFPLGRQIDRDYEEKIALVVSDYDNQLSDIKSNETRDLLEEEKHAHILQLEYEQQSKKQENSVIGRIGKFIEPTIQPLGFDWKMGVSLIAGMAAKEIVISTMGVLYQTGPEAEPSESLITKLQDDTYRSGTKSGQKVMRPLVALSFLVFVLIYFPCVAVFAAIKKESGAWKWPLFTSFYTTSLAWIAAFAVYQIGLLLGY
ncbi:MAG: ferrous iron transport protein B [Bacteroidales bacterium]|jgi:ferrous iron transport protein B|nr:ferrous iron transport protein B [Bacteroidales bacterium]MDD4087683.1 ferrous iron transport protein B [Bacteroidales bacterium]MDY0084612.1 ferrous iron transport protein B [Bacteroidales bacterium]